jgi:DNA polymerase-3 subunit delta'
MSAATGPPALFTDASLSQSVWPVYGHEWAVHLLQRTLQPGASGPRHAYLLLGPPQVGKSTLARAFAQTLLCSGEQRPCGACRACRLMAKGSHPDFRLVQPRDKEGAVDRAGGTLKVEQAADLIHEAALSPVEARYKVFLIQDAHTANDSFANKLLKTLEEPPDSVVLLLSALDRASVLPTIASRCQVIELRPLLVETVQEALISGWQAEPAQAALLARLAGGRLGWAVEQLADPEGANRRQEQLAQLWRLVAANRVERLDLAEQMATGRNNQQLFGMLALWESWWRDVLLVQSGCAEACCHIDQQSEIARQAAALSPDKVRAYLHTLQRLEGYLHHTVNTRLALDVLVLRLPHAAGAAA